jgi:hypothetical protein
MARIIHVSDDYPSFFPCNLELLEVPNHTLANTSLSIEGDLTFIHGDLSGEYTTKVLSTITVDKFLPEWAELGFLDFPEGQDQMDEDERETYAMRHVYKMASELFKTNIIWCPWC